MGDLFMFSAYGSISGVFVLFFRIVSPPLVIVEVHARFNYFNSPLLNGSGLSRQLFIQYGGLLFVSVVGLFFLVLFANARVRFYVV